MGLDLLVMVSVASVLAIGLWSGHANTLSLLSDKAELAVSSALAQIDQHLTPAEEQVAFVADLIARAQPERDGEARLPTILNAALAAAAQIKALVFIDTDHQLVGDTVNVAQRLEQLGKEVDTGASEVVALASAATAEAAGPEVPLTAAGSHRVPGRKESIEVYRLV